MALYTTLLRSIVEQRQADAHVGPDDFTVAYATLGLDSYPIFDESYRQQLNDKIIRHFYFREIGQETVARFRWYMDMTMRENMPYFNQLYGSLNLIIDPITNVRYTYRDVFNLATEESGTGTTSRTGAGSSTETETHAGDDVTELDKGTTRTETLSHGRTETETLDHGHVLTEATDYGREQDTTDSTTYGRTEATVNGGSDQTLEGATKEREIRSDTPMNQIPTGAIEAGNYATEATYTEREGQRAGTTTYGGTTNVTFGGTDSASQNVATSGTDTTTHTHSGQDVTTRGTAGTDTTTKADTGTDTTTLTHGETVTTEGSTSTTEGIETGDTRTIGTDTTKDHTGSGYQGTSPARLLEEYRKTFLNVDMQVIASLESLFLGLWE